MRGVRAWLVRLVAAVTPWRRDRALADELNGHLDLATEDNVRAGMTPEEARRRALVELGGFASTSERCRERHGMPGLEAIFRDIRYSLRALGRSPSFTAISALSLAIGIAGNAAIFSVADAVLLQDRPGIAHPDRLVDVGQTRSGKGFDNFSYPNYLDYRDRNTVFEDVAAYRDGEAFGLGVGGDGGAVRVHGGEVSGNYFRTLGVPMALGPGFRPEQDHVGGDYTAVVSDQLWRSQFQANPAIIGRTVRLNGRPFAIVGVAPADFVGNGLYAEDLWVPITASPEGDRLNLLTRREGVWLHGIARLKPGVTLQQAISQVDRIGHDLALEYPEANRAVGLALTPAHSLPVSIRPMVTIFVAILFTLVGLILLIACTNVSGMLLARGAGRVRELGVRAALGGVRAQIVRLLLTESLVLALASAIAGIACAYVVVRVLTALVPPEPYPMALTFHLDWRVIGFSIALAVGVGILCGLLPALHVSRGDLVSSMKADGGAQRTPRLRLRQMFVTAQTAMSVLLVVCALLLVQSLKNAYAIDPGFSADHVEIAGISPELAGYDRDGGLAFAQTLVERTEQLPGVTAATLTRVIPLTGSGYSRGTIRSPGQNGETQDIQADWNLITPRYFDTLRTPIARGRAFTNADQAGTPEVAIVNETLARRTWPGQDPVGQTLLYAADQNVWRTLQIVGVVRDGKYRSLGEEPRSFIYAPITQHYASHELWLLVRTDGGSVAPALRTLVRQMDPNMPFTLITTLTSVTSVYLLPHRVAAWLAAAVALIGLLLAALGIYGVTAYTVSQRTREIGVRVALGATRAEVLRLVTRQGATLAGAGMLLGLGGAMLATRLLASMLYGIQPLDPISFAGGGLLLTAIALVASLIPARRAMRMDPVAALRYE